MGGTSFDVGLIVEGRPLVSTVSSVGKYRVFSPMIGVQTIGAGGGSIARVEDGRLLVGPRSAGAEPGPACYGRGGTEPTVADADLVLGILDPDYFLGGRIKLRTDLATAAIQERIAAPLGLSVQAAASAVRSIVDSRMADLLHRLTFEKGHDPRDFVLFSYGGAGPSHCAAYGRELGVRGIVVPASATVHSAYGGLASDIRWVVEVSQPMRTPAFAADPSAHLESRAIDDIFRGLERRGMDALRGSGIQREAMAFLRSVEMRYRRQTHRLVVPVEWQGECGPEQLQALVQRFERMYEEFYGPGAAFPEAGIEVTTFRVDAIGATPKPRQNRREPGGESPAASFRGTRPVYFGEQSGTIETPVFEGVRLAPGNVLPGPSIIEFPGTTVLVGVGQRALADAALNLVIESP
jgi:N-methylhydantoinase A